MEAVASPMIWDQFNKDVTKIVSDYGNWLTQSEFPKLWINVQPGAIMPPVTRDFVRTWPNLTETTVSEFHFAQEDSPHETGPAIREWHEQLVGQMAMQ